MKIKEKVGKKLAKIEKRNYIGTYPHNFMIIIDTINELIAEVNELKEK